MKIEINSVEIKEDQFKAILSISQEMNQYSFNSNRDLIRAIESMVVDRLAEKILLERGPEILNSVTNNQIINALIMRVAGAITPGER